MLDIFGSIFVTVYLGSILALALRRADDSRAFGAIVGFLLFWLTAEVAVAAAVERLSLPLQPNIAMFAVTMASLTAAWVFMPAFRRAASGTRLEPLLALNAWRLGGFFFLLLYAAGRLPSPFAQVAAIGDIITGAGAAVLTVAILRGSQPSPRTIGAWNMFGLLDLVAAVSLALLATPGALFQVFTDVPVQSAFTQLPWILVPAAIVPALFFVHLAIFRKLKTDRRELGNRVVAGARA